jgi:glutaminase
VPDTLQDLVKHVQAQAAPLRGLLASVHARHAGPTSGKVADYIPELATADSNWFALAAVTTDGRVVDYGDYQRRFTIQSISKPFMFGLALEEHGLEGVLAKVGVEPSGEAFNSIVLDDASNRPFNPMVNAGAIAVADLIDGPDLTARTKKMLAMFSLYLGREVGIDSAVFLSERSTGHRNRAIAYLMQSCGMIRPRVEETLELYFQQCSVLVDCKDLAVMAATLANRGVNPLTGARAISERYVPYLLSVMYTCGMYDSAGEWAFRVGLAAKSGVSGGILAVAPGQLGLAAFSPPLDAKGNSIRGARALADLANELGVHLFAASDAPTVAAYLKPANRTA